MTTPNLRRRRVIRILAAAPGLALISLARAEPARAVAAADSAQHLHVWRGVALGADATIQLHHPDSVAAKSLIRQALAEVRRLERVFSLYDRQSSLSTLNRDGHLDGPPLELVELLGQCERFSRLTGGAFDATVQPLWTLYATHFSKPYADPAGPAPMSVATTLRRIGHADVSVGADRIRFLRAGIAITLNGIAQGYVTDRVVDLLRQRGIDRSLVDMGEIRALGGRPLGGPWDVGLEDPSQRGNVAQHVMLDNQAVATSTGQATPLDAAERFNHIFDPGTGASSWRYRSVSVVADTACTADALSTAFSLMPLEAVAPIVRQLGLQAYFALPDGSRRTVNGAG